MTYSKVNCKVCKVFKDRDLKLLKIGFNFEICFIEVKNYTMILKFGYFLFYIEFKISNWWDSLQKFLVAIFVKAFLKDGFNLKSYFQFSLILKKMKQNCPSNFYFFSRSAHRTPNFMNPEFQFPQFMVLESVFFFFLI